MRAGLARLLGAVDATPVLRSLCTRSRTPRRQRAGRARHTPFTRHHRRCDIRRNEPSALRRQRLATDRNPSARTDRPLPRPRLRTARSSVRPRSIGTSGYAADAASRSASRAHDRGSITPPRSSSDSDVSSRPRTTPGRTDNSSLFDSLTIKRPSASTHPATRSTNADGDRRRARRPCARHWPRRWCSPPSWQPDVPLIDPFAGSGTIAIEAALIAAATSTGRATVVRVPRLAVVRTRHVRECSRHGGRRRSCRRADHRPRPRRRRDRDDPRQRRARRRSLAHRRAARVGVRPRRQSPIRAPDGSSPTRPTASGCRRATTYATCSRDSATWRAATCLAGMWDSSSPTRAPRGMHASRGTSSSKPATAVSP